MNGYEFSANAASVVDGRADAPAAELFLLDGSLRILSYAGEAEIVRGASFLRYYPASVPEQAALGEYLSATAGGNYLASFFGHPVLIFGTLLGSAGILLAAVPGGGAREVLSAPAEHLAAFEGLFACRALATTGRNHAQQDFLAALDLYNALARPLARITASLPAKALLSRLKACSGMLASQLDVRLCLDFGCIASDSVQAADFTRYFGVLLPLLFAVRRAGASRSVAISLRESYGSSPLLDARFTCALPVQELDELHFQREIFRARGSVFEILCGENAPEEVCLYASLGSVELSAQGVKEESELLRASMQLSGKYHPIPLPHAVLDARELEFD